MENETTQHNTIQYNIYICNTNNVCQLAESEARALVAHGRVKKQQQNNMFWNDV